MKSEIKGMFNREKLHRLSIVVFFIFCFQLILAQESSLQLKTPQQDFKIGDQITLQLTYTLPATSNVEPIQFKDTIIKAIEVIHTVITDTAFENNMLLKIIEQEITITSFDTGYHVIPPIQLKWSGDSVSTQPLLLHVTSIDLGEKSELKDIKDPIAVSFSLWEWLNDYWPYVLLAIILALLAYFIWWYLKKRKMKVPLPVVSIPVIPAHEKALNALKELREEQLWQKGEVKSYYSRISEILRQYIEDRFDIHALEQTTDEILLHLKFADHFTGNINSLKAILQLSDFVKFAKAKPESTENELIMKNAMDFVQKTAVQDQSPTNSIKEK